MHNLLSNHYVYSYPDCLPRSSQYVLEVDGEKADVFDGGKADFAILECRGPVHCAVESSVPPSCITVRPLSREIPVRVEGNSLRFRLDRPQNVCVDVPDQKPLFLYLNGPETDRPSPHDPGVHYFAAGRVHEVGRLELRSGETLYIEGGAVVRGCVVCRDAQNVRICGRGILDGSCYQQLQGDERVRSIVFERCSDVRVEDIVMIHPSLWMLVFGRSENIHVKNLRQIGCCMSSDGIDICGSRNVLIEDCCLRNEDDNIAVKSVDGPNHFDWRGDVDNVRVRRCVLLNGLPGNAMEIGYELRAERVRNIVFEDIDVIAAHGEGAVFSIHNGDRAVVENVRWEDIRVERYWDKIVDFRVVRARYNKDKRRGRIRGIHLKNVHITQTKFNLGCCASLISGYRAEEPAEDILFEDFYIGGRKVLNADQLDLHTRNVRNIQFR